MGWVGRGERGGGRGRESGREGEWEGGGCTLALWETLHI